MCGARSGPLLIQYVDDCGDAFQFTESNDLRHHTQHQSRMSDHVGERSGLFIDLVDLGFTVAFVERMQTLCNVPRVISFSSDRKSVV